MVVSRSKINLTPELQDKAKIKIKMLCIDLTNNIEWMGHVFCTVYSTVTLIGTFAAGGPIYYFQSCTDSCAEKGDFFLLLGTVGYCSLNNMNVHKSDFNINMKRQVV